MKTIIGLILTLLLFNGQAMADAASTKKKLSDAERKERREARRLAFNKYYGGYVNDTRNQKGDVTIVNAQENAPAEWLSEPIEWLSDAIKVNIKTVQGKYSYPSPKQYGSLTIFIIADETTPSLLIAPEQKWCVINVAQLNSSQASFFRARVQKEVVRAFSMLCGAFTSSFNNPIVGAVFQKTDLDNITDYRLPKDVVKKCSKYLEESGVTPFKRTTYRNAVEEGWAAAPTNDIQKAIWKDVHSTPQKPMKIEFDPKKGR